MRIDRTLRLSEKLYISDLEYHEHGPYAGYITAIAVVRGKYCRETLFRVYDPRATRNMTLVQIENAHLHPGMNWHWREAEQGFINICKSLGLGPTEQEEVRTMNFASQICDRCHKATIARIMSMFNTDMICPECKEAERKHPLYGLASQKEREALQRGERNFPGIGWPPDEVADDTGTK